MNKRSYITIGIVLLVALSTCALIWHQLYSTDAYPYILIDEKPYDRGSLIVSQDDYVQFLTHDIHMYLDKNTEIQLEDTRQDSFTIRLIQGRIIIEGDATIRARNTFIDVSGTVSAVHYSWRDELDLQQIHHDSNDDPVIKSIYTNEKIITHNQFDIRLNTLNHSFFSIDPLIPNQSSSAEFYEFYFENTSRQ